MDIKTLVGKRALFRIKDMDNVQEVRVMEVSPSGEWIKLTILAQLVDFQCWKATAEAAFVEALQEP